MIIESIQFDHFRNIDRLSLEFDEGINLFYGDNAQGKTNILEAVYLCGTSRSHRGSRDRDMIQFSREESHIRMQMRKKGIPYRIDMHLKKNRAKGIAINGTPIRKAAELVGLGHFVFFSPEDLNMIKEGPSERRRFLDMELCQLDAVYFKSLADYNKILSQRNHLLKEYGFQRDADGVLDVLDEQLIRAGRSVIGARRKFVSLLSELIGPIHRHLSGGRERLEVSYENDTDENHFSDRLSENRERDIRTGITNIGPHRDDLCFQVNGSDIRKFGSQGQQRTAALSLKLAEIEIVRRTENDTPVLLLDDVLSELDSSRQSFLLDQIHDIQTLITCTGVDEFINHNFQINKTFQVVAGGVR